MYISRFDGGNERRCVIDEYVTWDFCFMLARQRLPQHCLQQPPAALLGLAELHLQLIAEGGWMLLKGWISAPGPGPGPGSDGGG